MEARYLYNAKRNFHTILVLLPARIYGAKMTSRFPRMRRWVSHIPYTGFGTGRLRPMWIPVSPRASQKFTPPVWISILPVRQSSPRAGIPNRRISTSKPLRTAQSTTWPFRSTCKSSRTDLSLRFQLRCHFQSRNHPKRAKLSPKRNRLWSRKPQRQVRRQQAKPNRLHQICRQSQKLLSYQR